MSGPVEIGSRFGRLVTIRRERVPGKTYWHCRCDCGSEKRVAHSNLQSGTTQSCGCLRREQLDRLHAANCKPRQPCKVEGCGDDTSKGGKGYCGMHAQRVRRYGHHDGFQPVEVAQSNRRSAQLARVASVKPTTYRKLNGRHEHRVIGEMIAGRPLRRDEHVHHIDGNKHNNSPENLQVMTAKEHAALHASGGGFHGA